MSRQASLTVRWCGSGAALFIQGRTSPTNDCHRVAEVCRKTQSSPDKYVPDQNQRTAP